MSLGFGGGGGGSVDLSAPGPIGAGTPSTGAFTSLDVASGTITSSNPALEASQTWNNGAVAFTGLKLNITDTASNSASLLMDIQKGGTTVFAVGKNNSITLGSGFSINGTSYFNLNLGGSNKFGIGGSNNISYQNLDISSGFRLSIGGNVSLAGPAANTLQIGENHATEAAGQSIKGPNTTTGIGGYICIYGGSGSDRRGDVILGYGNGDTVLCNSPLRSASYAFASIPSGVSPGDEFIINDSDVVTGNVSAGGGSSVVKVIVNQAGQYQVTAALN